MKIQKHIQIVRSTSIGFSSMSDRSCQAIFNVLAKHYAKVCITTVNNSDDLEQLLVNRPDLAFVGMKFIPDAKTDQKIWISKFLEDNNIPHTSSGSQAIMYDQDKELAKNKVAELGVPTAKYAVIRNWQLNKLEGINLNYPMFVKPLNLGGGEGVDSQSLVNNLTELSSKVKSIIYKQKTTALIEEYLPGREFSVAVLKDLKTGKLTPMPLELVAAVGPDGEALLSQEVKLANSEIVLPVTDTDTHRKVATVALQAFKALGGRNYGRIDMRMDATGVPHFLEANLIPSLIAGYGSFPKACVMSKSMEYEDMILEIVKLGFDYQKTANTDNLQAAKSTESMANAIPVTSSL